MSEGDDKTAKLEVLAKLRAKLLDLTGMNRLLNFKYTAGKTLEFYSGIPAAVYDRLVASGSGVELLPLPEPKKEDWIEKNGRPARPDAAAWAKARKIPLDRDIAPGEGSGEALQTGYFSEDLRIRSRKLDSAGRLAIEETGANVMFLAMGFLEYPDVPGSDRIYCAPLISVPVCFTFEEERRKRIFLDYTGGEVSDNQSLVEKLRRDHQLELPSFDDESGTFGQYIKDVQAQIAGVRGFRIQNRVCLGLLKFGNMLLIRDLDPANWPSIGTANALLDHPIVQEVVLGARTTEENTLGDGEDYDVETGEADKLALVFDADSSQHSALVDVLLHGKNLVIEGPPGTGKSQTITNLIAAAVNQGKTVLFVSEKLAALQVVRSRLHKAGLDDFVLELHSTKTGKKEVLESLRSRAKWIPRRHVDLAASEQRVLQYRAQLSDYARVIQSPVLPGSQLSVHDAIWKAESRRQRLGPAITAVEGLTLSKTAVKDETKLVRDTQVLEELGSKFAAIDSFGPQHPLWGFHPSLALPGSHRRFAEALDRVIAVLEQGYGGKALLLASVISGWPSELTGCGLRMLEPGHFEEIGRSERGRLAIYLSRLESLIGELEDFGPEAGQLSVWATAPESASVVAGMVASLCNELGTCLDRRLTAKAKVDELLGSSKWLQRANREVSSQILSNHFSSVEDLSIDEVELRLSEARALIERVAEVSGRLGPLVDKIGLGPCRHRADLDRSLPTWQVLAEFPIEEGECFTASIQDPRAYKLAGDFFAVFPKWHELKESLGGKFALDIVPASEELRVAVRSLKVTGLFRVFSSDWKRAVRLYRSLLISVDRTKPEQMERDLARILEYKILRTGLESHRFLSVIDQTLDNTTPETLKGVALVVQWVKAVRADLERRSESDWPAAFAPDKVASSRLVGRELVSSAKDLNCALEALEKGIALRWETRTDSMRQGWAERVKGLAGHLRDADSSLRFLRVAGKDGVPVGRTILGFRSAEDYSEAEAVLNQGERWTGLLGPLYRREDTSLGRIAAFLSLFRDLNDEVLYPGEIGRRILRAPAGASARSIYLALDWLGRLGDVVDELAQDPGATATWRWEAFLPPHPPLAHSVDNRLKAVAARLRAAKSSAESIYSWTQYLEARMKAEEHSMTDLMGVLESGLLPPAKLTAAWEYLQFRTMVSQRIESDPQLRKFSGRQHSDVQESFRKHDKDLIKLRGSAVAANLPAPRLVEGHNGLRVDEKTEHTLLKLLFGQTRPRMPVRKFLSRASRSVQTLKPVFMMGPQAVAQFLTPGSMSFDLVVMDEASQLPPEEAIGVIARGRQLVVVGDPKQLPPTSFFSRSSVLDDEEDEITTDVESILDLCIQQFRYIRTLKWHYRSQHHSLIAFSNHHFYENRLVVLPSPYKTGGALGVTSTYLPDAIYEGNQNLREAEEVVSEVLEHVRLRPEESLGVATLNAKQRELIEELLDKAADKYPPLQVFRKERNLEGWPLFVKNLENIQGDERDRILISTTFGRTRESATPAQRFGPINEQGGKRRLNVLFTRARHSIHVITSLRPEQIVADPASKGAARYLRAYLEFAKTGLLDQPMEGAGEPESDFEVAVMTAVQGLGYNVTPQLGVAGYRIDLAVIHPHYPWAYLAAIECDGARYHSSRSARDRDRIRQEILEGLNWKGRIWRIWSTDWFQTPVKELARLESFLKDLVETWKPDETYLPRNWSPEALATVSVSDEGLPPARPPIHERVVSIGDRVTYCYESAPDKILTVTISSTRADADHNIVPRGKPLANALLGCQVGATVDLRIDDLPPRRLVILSTHSEGAAQ